MALENNIRPTDVTYETDGVRLVVDEVSIEYLEGATIDYVESVMEAGSRSKTRMRSLLAGVGARSVRKTTLTPHPVAAAAAAND